MKNRSVKFPPAAATNVKAFFTPSILLAQCVVGGILFGLVATFLARLFLDVPVVFSIGVGAVFGYELYRILREDSDSRRYESITFKPESMVVHFHARPQIEIPYKDIADVRYSYGAVSLSLTIAVRYPFFFLDLENLENGMDKVFLNYLKSMGVGK